MKQLFKKFNVGVLIALYSLGSVNSSYADDTEIFFNGSSASGMTPNVLFIFDTSGSMNRGASGSDSNESRIDVMRDVMFEFISEINDLKIGMARFSSRPGGPILNAIFDVNAATDPVALSSINSSDDDATENSTSGKVNYTETTLDFNIDKDTDILGLRFNDLDIPQGAKITNAYITFSSYDTSVGDVKYSISGELVGDAQPFTGDKLSDRMALNITSNFAVWTPEDWTAPSPLVDENGDPVPPNSYVTSDLTNVVQEIVNLGDWCGGNSMAFFIQSPAVQAAFRSAISYDGDDLYAPRIRIEFDADPATIAANTVAVSNAVSMGNPVGCYTNRAFRQISNVNYDFEYENNSGSINFTSSDLDFYSRGRGRTNVAVGLHFDNVQVPPGVTVLNAYLEVVANDSDNGNASATIEVLDTPNAIFSETNPKPDAIALQNGSKLPSVSWTLPNFTQNIIYQSPSLTSQIQSIVNKGGWTQGNGISMYIKTPSGNRDVVSADQSFVRAPRLVIEFRGSYDGSGYTKRDEMKQIVQDFQARGLTPISDTLLEVGLYYRGEEVLYGKQRGIPANRYNRISNPNSFDSSGVVYTPPGCDESDLNSSACTDEEVRGNPNYISPIVDSCQKNFIVLLTDGAPTSHATQTTNIYNRWSGGSCSSQNSGEDCAIKIAGFLNNNDQSTSIPGKQIVTTYTIGFDYDSEFLRELAAAGGGDYFTADNRETLLEVLNNIADSILKTNTTFVSAGLTVNQYNRLTHNDELYYSLFEPSADARWAGNLKRYRLLEGKVVDVRDVPAIDPLNGEFKPTAQSWWSGSVDGNEVIQGGVAEQQQAGRTLYSNLDSSTDLTSAVNTVSLNNNLITQGMLNAGTSAERDEILEWALGFDINDPTRSRAHQIIGDPLHSRPTLLSYNIGGVSQNIVYVGTNNGYLHVFDSATGKELWSFIPKELLDILKVKKDNLPSSTHEYGVDGEVSIYLDDKNGNSVFDSGEKAYLYVGMRRGGTSYYAFDITDPTSPKMLFDPITPATPGFSKLGQTWSKPVVAKMNIGGVSERLVMIFGGGYDTAHDTIGSGTVTPSVGNVIYIADALTGEYIWDSSLATQVAGVGPISSMNSVPGNIKAFDLNDDDLVDHLYVGDMGGQVFRFDVDNDNQTIRGGRIAKLQTSSDPVDNRRFYNSPDVALIKDFGTGATFVTIAIGSGYRAHPLDATITEHMYVLRDKGVLKGEFVKDIRLSDLVQQNFTDSDGDGIYDVTEELSDPNSDKHGWYYDFITEGEKVLADSLTFNNALLFTTYTPPPAVNVTGDCTPPAGSSRIYAMSILDGAPYVDTNFDGQIDENDIYIDLAGTGIAPEPQVIMTQDPNGGVRKNLCVGRNCGLEENGLLPPTPERLMPIKWRHVVN